MNKTAVRFGVAALLIGAGAGVGFLLGRPFPAAPARSDEVRIHFRPGDDTVFTAPPQWTEWEYPGSKVENSTGGSGYKDMRIEYSTGQRAVLTTPDDFDMVCEFYKKKCDLRPPGDSSVHARFDTGGSDKDYYVTLYETRHGNWFEGAKQQDTRTMGFQVSTVRYHLAGFISRGKGASATQVVLAYRPLTEFVSVARQLQLKP